MRKTLNRNLRGKLIYPWVNLLTLRDGQQSTLKPHQLNFSPIDWGRILSKAHDFKAAEVAGGQSFQSALGQGLNPFSGTEYTDLITRDAKGNRIVDLQMLFRGANALGFRHYAPASIEAILNEFVRLGITKIRFFDALNDKDNIYIPKSLQSNKKLNLQGALCFGYYKEAPDRYTNEYYLNYAQALVDKGCTSLAIKDMSGQLDGDRAKSLISQLKYKFFNKGVAIELHIHSTDKEKSLAAIKAAIEAGVDGIETVEGPLKQGSSHHDLASIDTDKYAGTEAYQSLVEVSNQVFANSEREDTKISREIKEKLCEAGVPGGAMPFVLGDLKVQSGFILKNHKDNREIFTASERELFDELLSNEGWRLDKCIQLFLKELPRVCRDANYPLLVTPTADICTKQAILNLRHGKNPGSDALVDRYSLIQDQCDERFVKLILGHYGQMKSYATSDDKNYYEPDSQIKEFFRSNYLGIEKRDDHPYLSWLSKSDNGEFAVARDKAKRLIEKARSYQTLSFASEDQLSLIYVLAPLPNKLDPRRSDPVELALEKYVARTARDFQQRGLLGVPCYGFEYLFEPLFKHIDALSACGRRRKNPLAMKISKFGNLGQRMYEVYTNLPSIKHLREFLATAQPLSSTRRTIFDSNIVALRESFRSLFKNLEKFTSTSLKDLVINLSKLSQITKLIDPERKEEFNEQDGFVTNHLQQLQGLDKRLNQYLADLRKLW